MKNIDYFIITLIMLFVLIYFIICNIKNRHLKTGPICSKCGYQYPNNYDTYNSTWITSKHKNPKTGKSCDRFFHLDYEVDD